MRLGPGFQAQPGVLLPSATPEDMNLDGSPLRIQPGCALPPRLPGSLLAGSQALAPLGSLVLMCTKEFAQNLLP